jgi:adenylyltransferase/sulfurtransferase
MTALCGRDAVQVSVAGGRRAGDDGAYLAALAERFTAGGASAVRSNSYLLRATVDRYEFTVFPDGRAIIKGVNDEAVAATLYARYVGM